MIDRRSFLIFGIGINLSPSKVFAQSETWDGLLARFEQESEDVLKAKRFNELSSLSFVPPPETLKQRPDLPRTYRRPSKRAISNRTRQLLIAAEVSSKARYESRYKVPIWPKGQSGVTCGIGYDIGYVTASQLRTDWLGYIDEERIKGLEAACEIKGIKADPIADKLKHIEISWDEAVKQFDYFLKLYMNLVEATFPNCNALTDDSFGALTSLVYNRGNAMRSRQDDPIDRRREMREIRALMSDEKYAEVPGRIRAMKRIWEADPDSRGLLLRRDAEAELFELGLGGK